MNRLIDTHTYRIKSIDRWTDGWKKIWMDGLMNGWIGNGVNQGRNIYLMMHSKHFMYNRMVDTHIYRTKLMDRWTDGWKKIWVDG